MHIALCDDNVADRKQFERLTKRESDKRAASTGIIYVNSFGNAETLLHNPMQYDAFYIDVCQTEGITGQDIAHKLIEQGVNAPIILCCSKINYRELKFPENVFFLDKPLVVAEFATSLDRVQEIASAREHLIELRVENHTQYVREADILYALQRGMMLDIQMTDGSTITILDTAINFFRQAESHKSFFRPTANVVINGRHLAEIKLFHVVMTDGKSLPLSHSCKSYAKKMYDEFHGKVDK